MSAEEWRPIPGYDGAYEASTLGRVRALDRITDRGRKWRGQMMTPTSIPRGYQVVTLWRGGKQSVMLVHRLVLLTFIGPAPDGMEALHGNGDPKDNSISNLRWGTHAENQADQVAHGTHVNASKEVCPSGHPYTEENTYYYPGKPHRACRQCRRINMANWVAKNRERHLELNRESQRRYKERKKAA